MGDRRHRDAFLVIKSCGIGLAMRCTPPADLEVLPGQATNPLPGEQ